MRIHQNRIDLSRGKAGENEGGPYPGTSGVAATGVKWTATDCWTGEAKRRRRWLEAAGESGADVMHR